MRISTILLLMLIGVSIKAQLKKPTMAPIFEKGYYVNFKGDTVRGNIQVNPPYETEFYRHFYFKANRGGKPKLMDTQKVKAYGFSERHFVRIENDGRKEFAERLVYGRLRFFESRYPSDMNDPLNAESEFFVRDAGADDQEAELREIKRINPRFYKKGLKPYMKDQPMIWSDLDKFNFDKKVVTEAIKEFNKMYSGV